MFLGFEVDIALKLTQMYSYQIGDGTSGVNRLTPVDVIDLGNKVASISLGYVSLFLIRGFVALCCFTIRKQWSPSRWIFCVPLAEFLIKL